MKWPTNVVSFPGTGFRKLVLDELAAAHENYGPIRNTHEAYAIILEEVEEFWAETRKRSAHRSAETLLAELVQIAAMAERAAVDLQLCQT